jgi:hypothetical protein
LTIPGACRGAKETSTIANPVLVPKKNGKWWICVEYKTLNKASLKDPFPLPQIEQVVDLTARCELLSFLDA